MEWRRYPTLAQREMARTRDIAGLEAETRRTGSAVLWALLLDRKVIEATSAEEAERHWRRLNRVVDKGRSLYALEQAAFASLQVVQLELVEASLDSARKCNF